MVFSEFLIFGSDIPSFHFFPGGGGTGFFPDGGGGGFLTDFG